MSQSLTCPSGHRFEPGSDAAAYPQVACPICGASVATSAGTETVDAAGSSPIAQGQPLASAGQGGGAAGRFTILWEHARGGLGQISLAQDNSLGRQVAVKQIRPDRVDSPRSN
jgi:hypothetical protein